MDTPVPAMLDRVRSRAAQRRRRRRTRDAFAAAALTLVVVVVAATVTSSLTTSSVHTTPAEEGDRPDAQAAPGGQSAGEAGGARPGGGPSGATPGAAVLPPSSVPTTLPPRPHVIGPTTTVPPPPAPAGDRTIAFERSKRIWLMQADGSGVGPLTDASRWVANPDWAPDGRRLVALEARSDTTGRTVGRISVVGLDGAITSLTPEAAYALPKWSPDGARIAYLLNVAAPFHPLTFELWVMDADGSDARKLVDARVDPTLSWSPDSTRIAFIAEDGVCTIRPDGTDKRCHDDGDGSDGSVPTGLAWAPDADRLAVSYAFSGGSSALVVMNVDASDHRVVVEGHGPHGGIDWSPDGRTLIYGGRPDTCDDSATCWGLWRVDVDGSHHRGLTPGSSTYDISPSWRP